MKIRIGTRGSQLALTQTGLVAEALKVSSPECEIEIVTITTRGDKKQGTPQAAISDKKEWVAELEHALLADEIDLAVHSAKDLPALLEPGTFATSALKRATPFDIFIPKSTLHVTSIQDLPEGAVVGTASLRRRASLLHLRRDLTVIDHRGNVPTRLQKLEEHPEMSGIILAAAGLERLGFLERRFSLLPQSHLLPAMNQGILAVQFCKPEMKARITPLTDNDTQCAFVSERRISELLGADCRSALGIHATTSAGQLSIEIAVFSVDGAECIRNSGVCQQQEWETLAERLATELLEKGASSLLKSGADLKRTS